VLCRRLVREGLLTFDRESGQLTLAPSVTAGGVVGRG
jgi:hypothetical protein